MTTHKGQHLRDMPPICLDLTRMSRRVDRGTGTGVDRVDRAYFDHFLNSDCELYGLIRTRIGHLILDRRGLSQVGDRLTGRADWVAPGPDGPQPRKVLRREALRVLRRHAAARGGLWTVAHLMARQLPAGTRYLNVGHSNVRPGAIQGAAKVQNGTSTVMVHDTLPLDLPHYQGTKVRDSFARMVRTALTADMILANSTQTKEDIERYAGRPTPPIHVLPLGVRRQSITRSSQPPGSPPRFIVLSTIEPRKNHGLLLDVWQHFHDTRPVEEIPHLSIVGNRGWMNEEVFARLDSASFMGVTVHEMGGLSDADLAAELATATALLFPSRAEGYGLPPMEAAAIGLPVICSDLAPVREILGDYAVYADATDMYQWVKAIDDMATEGAATGWKTPLSLPTWDSHFAQLRALL